MLSVKSKVFKSLISRPNATWTRVEVMSLTNTYIEALCIVMGVPKSGTKAVKVKRLFTAIGIFKIIKSFDRNLSKQPTQANALFFAYCHDAKFLRSLCREAKIFTPSTKYGMAMSLINWRRNCIRRGTQAYRSARSEIAQKRAS